ncbi:MAG: glutamate-ammonia-ligase adenylyltransferase [Gammaproteobacteria bacterium]|nr:glutamate-ammonia-ligase adenylyltransferase [Gammaproteobacteria bacterium]MBU1480559.1 glutamate-ammonia-ligase adenylyltransferase [Gammaproteobacteria bacterium]
MRNKQIIRILSVILVLGAVYWFGLRTDPKVEVLNQALNNIGSPALRNFPYSFRVVRQEGETAVMGTPRSPEVPVYRMIGAIYPNLSGKAANDPDFVAAEKELAQIQSEARKIVLDQPGITSVKWELDRNWLIAHNIQIN